MPSFRPGAGRHRRGVGDAGRGRRAKRPRTAATDRRHRRRRGSGAVTRGRSPADATSHAPRGFDNEWGGFGGAPKFPQTDGAGVAPSPGRPRAMRRAHAWARVPSTGWLRGHPRPSRRGASPRYSTDARWHVPHFEKYCQTTHSSCGLHARGWTPVSLALARHRAGHRRRAPRRYLAAGWRLRIVDRCGQRRGGGGVGDLGLEGIERARRPGRCRGLRCDARGELGRHERLVASDRSRAGGGAA